MEMDDRFSKLVKDPSYKKISKKERKVKIDSRFEKMFTDENFQSKFTTDKRGRVLNVDEAEDLHDFYDIDKTDDQEKAEVEDDTKEPVESVKIKSKKKKTKKGELLEPLSNKVKTSGKDKMKKKKKKKKDVEDESVVVESPKVDFDDIRGEAIPDDSDSDSGVSDAYDDEEDIDGSGIIHGWGDLDENVKYIENAETSRLAVCNCDWDKIGANDLYILFHSFKPVDGQIKAVKIYPSDFGIERMKEEKVNGPKELVETAIDSDNEEKESEEGSRFHMEKLREYQMNRLKYYYAIVECDSDNTANKLYEELDGQEYELSATRLDLRFVPSDTTFDREPSSVADGISQLDTYEPVNYHNTALQQSTVRLTWDESDTKRTQATMRKFSKEDIENMDFKDYLASSSDEEDEVNVPTNSNGHSIEEKVGSTADNTEVVDENKRIQIYKELMQEIESKDDNKRCDEPDTNVDHDTDQISSFPEISLKNSSQREGSDSDDDSDGSEDEVSENEDSNEDDNVEADSNMDVQADTVDFNDPFFADASEGDKKVKSKKKGKRSRNDKEELTEEDKKTKNELELLLLDESEDKKHFNLKDIMNREKSKKSKKKRRKEETVEETDDFELDVSDPRFSALYSSHLYALDPSEPNFKHTKATDAIIQESRKQQDKIFKNTKQSASSKNNSNSDLNGLLKSVKSKAQLHKWKKEKKKLK